MCVCGIWVVKGGVAAGRVEERKKGEWRKKQVELREEERREEKRREEMEVPKKKSETALFFISVVGGRRTFY